MYNNSIIIINEHYITNEIIAQLEFAKNNSTCINIFFGNTLHSKCQEYPFTVEERKNVILKWFISNEYNNSNGLTFNLLHRSNLLHNIGYVTSGILETACFVTNNTRYTKQIPKKLIIESLTPINDFRVEHDVCSTLFDNNLSKIEIKNTFEYYEYKSIIPKCFFDFIIDFIQTSEYNNIRVN